VTSRRLLSCHWQKAKNARGLGTFGLRIADCGVRIEGWMPAVTNMSSRAKQSQLWERWGIWRRRNIACGSVPPESRACRTKPISRRRQGCSRPRHETPYGVTTSMPDCTNKPNFWAGACAAIRGERGRSPYRAKQSQFAARRRETGGGGLEEIASMIRRNKASSMGQDQREVLYGKGVTLDSAMMRNKANLPRAGWRRRAIVRTKPIPGSGAGDDGMGIALGPGVW